MRLLIMPLLALPAASSAAPAPQAVYPPRVIGTPKPLDCPSAWDVYRARLPEGVRAQLLGDLPPGHLALAVERHFSGCSEPVIVRYDIGGSPDARGRSRPGTGDERRR